MKASFVLSVLALALTTQACDQYKYCACTNEDGSTNDVATDSACDPSYTRIHDKGYTECKRYKSSAFTVTALSNCKFREACQSKGAMGDSKCRAKVGVFKFKA
ncbi:hypothetical protein RB213_007962 [Colletotrichum asianum]|uniref:Uncharacterized protein n=1 Tax=Colletotrichum asianum TaxID=702518 RepID=A0A8H3ZKM2_9PEZI|nr:hypothetical protein GQ607_010034 [Colletotrichum asianum]